MPIRFTNNTLINKTVQTDNTNSLEVGGGNILIDSETPAINLKLDGTGFFADTTVRIRAGMMKDGTVDLDSNNYLYIDTDPDFNLDGLFVKGSVHGNRLEAYAQSNINSYGQLYKSGSGGALYITSATTPPVGQDTADHIYLEGKSLGFYHSSNGTNFTLGGNLSEVGNWLFGFGLIDNTVDKVQVGGSVKSTGSITGLSFIKTNGLNTEFLKADGSVDSTVYAANSDVVLLSGSYSNPTWIVSLDKAKVGLSNVDNTSDLNKPISTATQTALDLKQNNLSGTGIVKSIGGTISYLTDNTSNWDTAYTYSQVGHIPLSQKGAASGVAPLDVTSKIPSIYLPSYVDDVLEYANLASFPVSGELSVIYMAQDTNKTYRWSGSSYIEVSPSDVNSVNGQTGIVTLTTTNISEGSNLYYTDARSQTFGDNRYLKLSGGQMTGSVGFGVPPTSTIHIKNTGGVGSGLMTELTNAASYSTTDWKNDLGDVAQMLMTGSTFTNGVFQPSFAYFNSETIGGVGITATSATGDIVLVAGGALAANVRQRIFANGNISVGWNSDQGYKFAVNGGGYFQNDLYITGGLTANTIEKIGGLSTQFLKADGSVDNNTYEVAFTKNTAFNKNFGTTTGTVLEGRTFGTAANNNTGDFYATGSTVANSTDWNGLPRTFTTESSAPIGVITYESGHASYMGSANMKSWLGLSGGPFLPLTAGSGSPLTGDLYLNNGKVLFAVSSLGTVTTGIQSDNTAGYMGTFSNHPLNFRTNSITRYTIDTSGNNVWTGTGQFNGNTLGVYNYDGGTSTLNLVSVGNWTWSVRGMSDRMAFYRDGTEQGAFSGSGLVLNAALNVVGSGTFGGKVQINDGGNTTVAALGFSSNANGISYPGTNQLNVITNSVTRIGVSTTAIDLTLPLTAPSATFSLNSTAKYFNVIEASAPRGGLYTYNVISGSGTDYSVGLFSEGDLFFSPNGLATKRFTLTSSLATLGVPLTGTSATFNGTSAFISNLGASTTEKYIRIKNTGGDGYWGVESSTGNSLFTNAPAYSTAIGTLFNTSLVLGTNSVTALTINGSQNVGIGTTSPGYKLEVAGAIKATGAFVAAGNGSTINTEISYNGTGGLIGTTTNVPLYLQTNSTVALTIASNQVATFAADPIIPDEAYSSAWSGVLEPPTKNAIYDKIETLGGGTVGTYTPTLTSKTNIASSSAYPCMYLRIGDTVIVYGIVDCTTTATGNSELYITLPVASTFNDWENVLGHGNAQNGGANDIVVNNENGGNKAILDFNATVTTTKIIYFSFMYKII